MKFLSDKALERLRENADMPDLAGTRYSLLERVARGGMGVVYAARDEKLGRRVALKVLDAADHRGKLAQRLIREAQVLAQLEHPGIVPVHDVGTLEDGRVFYTMKFVEGQRLDKHIEAVESVSDRLHLFLRICDAVAFAHARGVLHRDLKPANIMAGPFGEILVLDWGLAKILRAPGDRPRHGDGHAGIYVTRAGARRHRTFGRTQRHFLTRRLVAILAERAFLWQAGTANRQTSRGRLRQGHGCASGKSVHPGHRIGRRCLGLSPWPTGQRAGGDLSRQSRPLLSPP